MPADKESRTPEMIFAVFELGLYVVRNPSPIAMEMGVVNP